MQNISLFLVFSMCILSVYEAAQMNNMMMGKMGKRGYDNSYASNDNNAYTTAPYANNNYDNKMNNYGSDSYESQDNYNAAYTTAAYANNNYDNKMNNYGSDSYESQDNYNVAYTTAAYANNNYDNKMNNYGSGSYEQHDNYDAAYTTAAYGYANSKENNYDAPSYNKASAY